MSSNRALVMAVLGCLLLVRFVCLGHVVCNTYCKLCFVFGQWEVGIVS